MSERAADERLLEQFRQWFAETSQETAELSRSDTTGRDSGASATGDSGAGDFDSDGPAVGLVDLVEAFTALRQEVKLQTKGSRGLQESTQSAVAALQLAIDQFRSVAPRETEAARVAARPLVMSLADLYESLERGRMAFDKSRERLLAESTRVMETIDSELARLPFWKRWLCAAFGHSLRQQLGLRMEQSQQPVVDSLLNGFGLIQQRLQRALQAHGLQRINCLGRPVDVNQMTVVELVPNTGQTAGTVIEEVRPGFMWDGDLIRFAEVKVAG